MEWQEVASYIFGFMGVAIAGWVARSIDKMRDSVEHLNVQIAVVISRTDSHEQRISKLEDKVE